MTYTPYTLGANQYGKAEVRLVTVTRTPADSRGEVHAIKDLNVSVALRGDLALTHTVGDNSHVVPTDTQKNTVYAFAKEHGVAQIEDFGLLLARHFTSSFDYITGATVSIEEYSWDRIPANSHSFSKASDENRTTVVTIDGADEKVVSGLKDLVVLKSTGSEFHGFPRDKYTTLPEATDRILATAVTATWEFATVDHDWSKSFAAARAALLEAFAETHSLSLQQTLFAMGSKVLDVDPEVSSVSLVLPNKHHFTVDLSPFDLTNENEVFFAADRPYGLIEGTVTR